MKVSHERMKAIIDFNSENYEEMLAYIEKHEKNDKLLELYIKIYNGITDYHDYDELSELQKEIKELKK